MTRNRSRQAETEDVVPRRLKRGAVKRVHVDRWAIGRDELAPGVVGETHLGARVIDETHIHPTTFGNLKGSAQVLVMSATGVSIASGGDYVTFDAIIHRHGFTALAPTDSVTWPVSAVGHAHVEIAWASYQGGGDIEIEVDGAVPPWGLIGSGTAGAEGRGTAPVHIAADGTVRLKVTQTSGVAQTADVTLRLSVADPTSRPHTLGLIETIWLDSRVGSVTGTVPLDEGYPYQLVVDGVVRFHSDADVDKGTPEPVTYVSPGQPASAKGEVDADVYFASADPGIYPTHWTKLRFNLGSGEAHIEPVGGPFSTPQPAHTYTFEVTGQGTPLQAAFYDSVSTDNNGLHQIKVYAV